MLALAKTSHHTLRVSLLLPMLKNLCSTTDRNYLPLKTQMLETAADKYLSNNDSTTSFTDENIQWPY